MILVDVVNFNADGSCVTSAGWLEALRGGDGSALCRFLRAYLELGRKVTLGFVGGTFADVRHFNPEAARLMAEAPDVFELLLRPFSHDISLLRTDPGFELNVDLGARLLAAGGPVTPWYLPPEFMLTSAQVSRLAARGVEGTFISPSRFKPEVQERLPRAPYRLEGVLGRSLACAPVHGPLTRAYLDSLHAWSARAWNHALAQAPAEPAVSWRDGESFLLIPDGVERERRWLAEERGATRRFVSEELAGRALPATEELPAEGRITHYPVHSFSEWVKEFRMLGFLGRVGEFERRLGELSPEQRVLFLQAANSDILSAVEKDSPVVSLLTRPAGEAGSRETAFTIRRSERGFEGEDYLALLEGWHDLAVRRHLQDSPRPHLVKLRARIRAALEVME